MYKSNTDKRVWGVCGGLARYFDVDPTLVRLLFVVLTLAGGPGLLLYIVLALVMPEAPRYEEYGKRKHDEIA
jgi:phage shock protein PspC (stress-responsive transcriptional regulator)